jgi:hypothetical protein
VVAGHGNRLDLGCMKPPTDPCHKACLIMASSVSMRLNHRTPAGQSRPASPPAPLSAAHADDYRAQLQQYASHLSAKAAEAAALRDQASQLKQQLAAAESRAAAAEKHVARNTSAAGQLEAAAAALEGQLQDRDQELQAALQACRAAEQAAAACKAQEAAARKAAAGKAADWEQDRRLLKEHLQAKDDELHRCAVGAAGVKQEESKAARQDSSTARAQCNTLSTELRLPRTLRHWSQVTAACHWASLHRSSGRHQQLPLPSSSPFSSSTSSSSSSSMQPGGRAPQPGSRAGTPVP